MPWQCTFALSTGILRYLCRAHCQSEISETSVKHGTQHPETPNRTEKSSKNLHPVLRNVPRCCVAVTYLVCKAMDKLWLTGQNLGEVFNPRLGCSCKCRAIAYFTKQTSLKLKTWPKQLLGSLPLAFALPDKAQILHFMGL
jgi:hypothetical protein